MPAARPVSKTLVQAAQSLVGQETHNTIPECGGAVTLEARWSFPRAPASRLRLRGGWPAQELWLGGQFGAQGPLCHQTITTVQSALSQGGGTGPLKPQKRILSPSGGQSPNSGAGARFLPWRRLPAPGPLGSWTLSPSACVFAWPSPLSSSVSRSLSLPWMRAQPNSARHKAKKSRQPPGEVAGLLVALDAGLGDV